MYLRKFSHPYMPEIGLVADPPDQAELTVNPIYDTIAKQYFNDSTNY